MIRRPPRSTHCISSAASDVYKRQYYTSSYKETLTFCAVICLALHSPFPTRLWQFWSLSSIILCCNVLNVVEKFYVQAEQIERWTLPLSFQRTFYTFPRSQGLRGVFGGLSIGASFGLSCGFAGESFGAGGFLDVMVLLEPVLRVASAVEGKFAGVAETLRAIAHSAHVGLQSLVSVAVLP
eukprot:TRINITY_DN7517_c0_g1_i2.p2 TRINITY_DN7517_c0_g1~~TRINITY_DN7517_c0_g1_i2.p2  ORF type:complete len:188 (+),score=16.66 TRINITY_DN7517_c0_g1_i2:23-565(+)